MAARRVWADRVLVWLACAFGLAVLLWSSDPGWTQGHLDDPDSYMRLAFLEHAIALGDPRAYVFPRDGAPWGMQIHWTLPTDLAIALAAAPLAPWLGWHRALAAVAPLAGPCMYLGGAWAVLRLSRACGLHAASRPWALALLALAPSAVGYARVGRVGHHAATAALAALALAAAVALVRRPSPRAGILAAACAALCLWQSMETAPAVLAAWGVAALGASARAAPRGGFGAHAAWLPVWGAAFYLLDPPPEGWASFTSERYSLFHLSLLAAAAAGICGARLARGGAIRAAVCALGPLLVWGAAAWRLSAHWPADPLYRAFLLARVSEIRPVWEDPALWGFSGLPALPALAFAAWRLWATRARPQRLLWCAVLALLGCETALGLLHARLAPHAALISCALLGAALQAGASRPRGRGPAGAALASFLACGAAAALWAAVPGGAARPAGESAHDCRLGRPYAERLEAALPPGAVVAADLFLSPEILWRTRALRTVAGPYHRNAAGVVDLAAVLAGPGDARAHDRLRARGAAAVLVCADPRSWAALGPGTLLERLARGDAPAWLRADPALRERGLRFYRVAGAADGRG